MTDRIENLPELAGVAIVSATETMNRHGDCEKLLLVLGNGDILEIGAWDSDEGAKVSWCLYAKDGLYENKPVLDLASNERIEEIYSKLYPKEIK